MTSAIRNIAVGLLIRDGWAMAEEHAVIPGHHRFVRAIGGGIEFGERAEQALRREFREELGVELTTTELLAVTENLYEIAGVPGHEIVHVFAVRCPELEQLPVTATLPVLDNDSVARWYRLSELAESNPPFYPDGVTALAMRMQTREG
ncbi:MAG: NUDIX domain-containing protein [Micropruina sp.]|uniref:NUDIX hydrolase n=1 Tax=Micropruina sp. TaxID=2737536 RepID=UPI0039E69FC0